MASSASTVATSPSRAGWAAAPASRSTFPSAEEALGKLNGEVQMVISDLHLPGVDGLAFYREAVSRVPVLKRRFLFITAGAIPEAECRALDLDQGRVLQKPFTRQQLLEAV